MRRIRGTNTTPELIVRKLVFSLGYRYRLHSKNLPGHPDLVFPGRRKIIFVHGCFWHGHDCNRGRPPTTRTEFWIPKLEKNKERDRLAYAKLASEGWQIMVIWQCELTDLPSLTSRISEFLGKR
jgi:DNA mismatch endonuclease (patch repair protein)